jgi:hypothetical protein
MVCLILKSRRVSDQIGDNTRMFRSTPVNVTGLGSGVQAIALGGVRLLAMQCCDCSACVSFGLCSRVACNWCACYGCDGVTAEPFLRPSERRDGEVLGK